MFWTALEISKSLFSFGLLLENSFETLETRMGEQSKERELQIHSVKSSVTVLMLIALVILGVVCWSVFGDKFI